MKFADPETQELFDEAIRTTASFSFNENFLLNRKDLREYDMAYKTFLASLDAFIAHVESRLRREQEPCEWELNQNKIIEDKIERVMSWWKFCPMCGRALEGK